MGDAPRRRRSEEEPPANGGGLPLFPLILVVVFAGLLLGGVLAHFFGSGKPSKTAPAASTFTISPQYTTAPVAMTSMRPSARPAKTVEPSAAPSATARPTPSSAPSPSPKVSPSPAATATSTARPAPTPSSSPRVVFVTPPPHRPATAPATEATTPAPTPAVVAAANSPAPNYVSPGPSQAATIVRSYLGALARGDRATATTYLAHGLPSEGFMDSSARILSITPEAPSGKQYHVAADVQTANGEYYITFTLQQTSGGLQITDHTAIKPQ